MQPYFSVDDLHEQERAAGKRRTDEERDLVTELHPQPAAERGHENGGDMVDGLSYGHGRGYVLRFGYLLEESTQGDGEIEHDVVDDVEHARDPRAARGGVAGEHQNVIRVQLKYGPNKEKVISGIKRISKPGLRVYTQKDQLPRVLGGLGIAVISTSKGMMTDKAARKAGLGGEVVAYVW